MHFTTDLATSRSISLDLALSRCISLYLARSRSISLYLAVARASLHYASVSDAAVQIRGTNLKCTGLLGATARVAEQLRYVRDGSAGAAPQMYNLHLGDIIRM